MNELYPLKFKPVFKEKIWGGQKIQNFPAMELSQDARCGEAWVLSGVKGDESVVTNGFLKGNTLNELVEVYMYDLTGEENFDRFGHEFPILVKFIDANDWLSIQVHPDDELAKKRKLGRGKSEMWYVLDAEPGAKLISGFSKRVNQQTFLRHLQDKSLKDILNTEDVNRNDVFYIPAGRVHALGPGVLLAEIQETSDTTYRIYDWDRVDGQGKSRDLHIEEAMEAIDFEVRANYRTEYQKEKEHTVNLVSCPHFTTNLVHMHTRGLQKDLTLMDSFIAYLCIKGETECIYPGGKERLRMGEVLLVPAMFNEILLNPLTESELLEIYIIGKGPDI